MSIAEVRKWKPVDGDFTPEEPDAKYLNTIPFTHGYPNPKYRNGFY